MDKFFSNQPLEGNDIKKRKILLLTDAPPNSSYSGSALTLSLIGLLPNYDFCFYVVVNPMLRDKEFDKAIKKNSPREIHHQAKEGNISLVNYYINKWIKFPLRARSIIKFAKRNQVDCIWSILQGQNIICLTDIIIKKSLIPVKVQIWDSFEWWLRARNIRPWLQKRYLKVFDQVILNAKTIAVASYNMAAEYHKKYNRNSNVFVSFLDKEIYKNSLKNNFTNENKDLFLIGFCGQLYAKNNFISLFKALNKIGWRVGNKKVKLRMMTYIKDLNTLKSYFDNIEITNDNIELIGWVKIDETIKMLRECDLLYCPYWFDEEFKLEAITSFPSKLTTYLATERPVLMHGPEYSSPYSFLEKYNAALFCNDLSAESLIFILEKMNNKNLVSEIITNANNAFEENLTPDVLRQEMKNFLSLINK